jgi:hypothetical protein
MVQKMKNACVPYSVQEPPPCPGQASSFGIMLDGRQSARRCCCGLHASRSTTGGLNCLILSCTHTRTQAHTNETHKHIHKQELVLLLSLRSQEHHVSSPCFHNKTHTQTNIHTRSVCASILCAKRGVQDGVAVALMLEKSPELSLLFTTAIQHIRHTNVVCVSACTLGDFLHKKHRTLQLLCNNLCPRFLISTILMAWWSW